MIASAPPPIAAKFYKQYKLKHNIDRVLRSLNCFYGCFTDTDLCINAAKRIKSFALSIFRLTTRKKIKIEDAVLFAQEKQTALDKIFKAVKEMSPLHKTSDLDTSDLDTSVLDTSDLDIDLFIEPIQTIIECDACIVFSQLEMDITPTTPSETLTNYLRMSSFFNSSSEKQKGLVLSQKSLMILPPELSLFTNLEMLKLNHNCLQFLPESLFKLNKLALLDVSYNYLYQLPDSISNLSQLVQLYCFNNRLRELPNAILSLKNLTDISVQNNYLKYLPIGLFSDLPKLHSINLNCNELEELPGDIDKAQKLSFLGFNNNKITALPYGLRRLGTNRLTMNITNNPYFTSLSLQDLKTLRSLHERGVSFRDTGMSFEALVLGPKKGWMSTDWVQKALGN